jgi:hypothetical protein
MEIDLRPEHARGKAGRAILRRVPAGATQATPLRCR